MQLNILLILQLLYDIIIMQKCAFNSKNAEKCRKIPLMQENAEKFHECRKIQLIQKNSIMSAS
jgi:hypothetical protein